MGSEDLYIGLISGTSADGIDAALVSFQDNQPRLLAHHLHPLPEQTKSHLLSLFTPNEDQIDLMGSLDGELGQLFADACQAVMALAGVSPKEVRAIGSHGQTIRHRPDQKSPFTLQIADPNRIVHGSGVDVVADFRRRDMVCGGQGAPLAPLFHQAFFSHEEENRVILNLGGIANITLLPARHEVTRPLAMDTGPASGLLDAWCQRHRHQPYDADGQWAREGQPSESLLQAWMSDPYFLRPAPKSTGKEYFHLPWAEERAKGSLAEHRPEDVQATLTELTARTVADAIRALPVSTDRVLVCGGGVHNGFLMERLNALAPCPVESIRAVGIDPDWVEATCFAWLAKCFVDGTRLETGPFTGASEPVLLGGLYKA